MLQMFITDAAINVYPTLEQKYDTVQNAIDLAHALRIEHPKVALHPAVETITPTIQSRLDAAALCKMAGCRQLSVVAVDLFVYRINRELGALAARLGGLDALVFTGGIGEHAAKVRARVCASAAWSGIRLDADANTHHGPRISSREGAVSAWVIPTGEQRMIAQQTCRVLASGE